MRTERRRQHRERQAFEMSHLQDNTEDLQFERIAPLLDEAINQLGTRDRAAIVLRFFEHRDLRTIGEMLGSNEDAAQKRVSRAVEKLRSHFARRGMVVTSTVIASVIAAHAVHAAPAGLASTVGTASLAAAAGAGSSSLLTAVKTLLMRKTTCTILTAALVAGIAVPLLITKADSNKAPVTVESLDKGLVLHMTFDRDETGGRITDSSGKENYGKPSGVRWTPDGKHGGAYEFASDGDQIVLANNPSLNPAHLTLSAWIKTTTGDHYWRRIFDKAYIKGYALSIAGDWNQNQWYGQASVEIGPGSHLALTKSRVDDGQWHQLAMTFDGNDELLYVDGQVQGKFHWNQPGRVGATDFNLVIGCNRSNLSNSEDDLGKSFRGLIAEPMMWNRALSRDEITFLFASQNGSSAGQ
jgi:hypothetical protein